MSAFILDSERYSGKTWGDEFLAFNNDDGTTLLLDDLSSMVLNALSCAENALSVEDLLVRCSVQMEQSNAFNTADSGDVSDFVTQVLSQFCEMGLTKEIPS